MFEDIIRELKRMEQGMTVSVPIEVDAEGYSDRKCPAENCLFEFKVHGEDWTEKFEDTVHCPLCGHDAPSDSWWTDEQIEHAKEQALQQVQARLGNALHRSAQSFNRRQPKSGFITMSMEYKGTRGERAVVPAPAEEPFDLKITCEECGVRFSVIGSAFFCPCCGVSSVQRMFTDAMRKVRVKLESAHQLRTRLSEAGSRDEAEIISRSLVETGLADCVVAHQRLTEQLYAQLPGAKQPPMNAFQRIDQGSELWRSATDESYKDWLTQDELHDLRTLFQRRHLLAHAEGIVDQRYLDKSGDVAYRVGQRIVVRPSDVERLHDLVGKLADRMLGLVSTLTGPQGSHFIPLE